MLRGLCGFQSQSLFSIQVLTRPNLLSFRACLVQQFLKEKKEITIETSHKWTGHKTRVWFFKTLIGQSSKLRFGCKDEKFSKAYFRNGSFEGTSRGTQLQEIKLNLIWKVSRQPVMLSRLSGVHFTESLLSCLWRWAASGMFFSPISLSCSQLGFQEHQPSLTVRALWCLLGWHSQIAVSVTLRVKIFREHLIN